MTTQQMLAALPPAAFLAAGLVAGAAARVPAGGTAASRPSSPAKRPAEKGKPAAPAPKTAAARAAAAAIWPAGLEKLAGRYRFAQVASPGGLWAALTPAEGGGVTRRQVSIHELPAELRGRLTQAEIVISGLKLPTTIEAAQRRSPSGRGMLRYYSESCEGMLQMRNLPGIGSDHGDRGEYSGPVVFEVEHQSHSNPSVVGILAQRTQQERTWGAATLDYADLHATPMPPAERAQGSGKAGRPEKPAPPDEDRGAVIANARVLRSGVEVFAFVEWRHRDAAGEHHYSGSVRLARDTGP